MSNVMDHPFLPVIYVRGYAKTMAEINETTADPYMGFNVGASMMRQDADKQPLRYIFESPLLRLIKDHGYTDAFHGGDDSWLPGTAPSRSIWIFRYYERVSETLGSGELVPMEQFAANLRRFILEVRDAVCGDDAERREAFQVYLVAHSMGGLLCRCYLQNICRHGAPQAADNPGLELTADGAERSYVDKLYTYATPHNGIELLGLNVPEIDLSTLGWHQITNFNRERMREYLKLPPGADSVNDLDGAFPVERCFCLVGSDYRDYQGFFGLSQEVTGPMSDGLVMMNNAWVREAPRAVVYRSHSGYYGILNSEAGYQNLRRFLFGQQRVTASLRVDDLTLPKAVHKRMQEGAEVRGSYYFDIATRVRAALYDLNERRHDQQSAILMTHDELIHRRKPVYLFTGYLLKQARLARDSALMFSIDVGIRVPHFEIDGVLWLDDHFEGFLYRDTITFAVRAASLRYGLASVNGLGQAPTAAEIHPGPDGAREILIPLATRAGTRPGFRGTIALRVESWNEQAKR